MEKKKTQTKKNKQKLYFPKMFLFPYRYVKEVPKKEAKTVLS